MRIPLKVLLVEDSMNDAELLLRELDKAGYAVEHARVVNSAEMESELAKQAWDMIIADFRLPRFNAPAALECLKKSGLDLPFLVISGAVGEEAAVAVMKAGASDYLSKDNLTRLAPVVERELGEARRRAELREAENLLRENEARFRAIFEYSPIALWEEDFSAVRQRIENLRAEGVRDFRAFFNAHPEEVRACARLIRVVDANKRSLELYGARSKPELLGNMERVIPADMAMAFVDELVMIATGQRQFEHETVNTTLDGTRIDIHLSWMAVSGHEEDLSRVIVSVQDISQRKRSERQLREAEARLRSLVEQVPVIVYTESAEQQGYISYISPQIESFSGYTPQEWQDELRFTNKHIHPDDLLLFERIDEDTRLTGQPFKSEYRMFTRDGRTLWVRDEAVLIRDEEGHPLFWQGVMQDITEQKLIEAELVKAHAELEQRVVERTAELRTANLELEKAARLKDEFLASMSHELRTPLTGILGLSDVLQLQSFGNLSEKQMAALKHISTSGRHLLELINDILDLSKIEARQLVLRPGPCDVQKICQSSLNAIAGQCQQKNLATSLSVDPPGLKLQADTQRLKQILSNLLSNAVKFTPAGGKLGIEVSADQAAGNAAITVWDTGIGIRAEDMPRLFQTFVQLDSSLSRKYNGTGLGLALVKRLTEMHGGSISVESIFGSGSRFTVRLPLPQAGN